MNLQRKVSRRQVIKLALLGSAAVALPAGGGRILDEAEELEDVLERVGQHHDADALAETAKLQPFLFQSDEEIESPPHIPYRELLPFPPVILPGGTIESEFGPAEHYLIDVLANRKEYIPGLRSWIWGFNGMHPGPTIIAQLGQPSVVSFTNGVPGKIIIHLHGGHQPHRHDGFAADFIAPGESRDFHYPNRPEAQRGHTLWYHDHREEVTTQHVYLGMAAFYILNDEYESVLRAERILPSGFAGDVTGRASLQPVLSREEVRDIPLVLQDRTIVPGDGRLFFHLKPGDKGHQGDLFLVNGAVQPRLEVTKGRYRFRILNGSPARDWNIALSLSPDRLVGDMTFMQIGTEGGLMIRAVERRNVLIGVAERYEVIVDFSQVPVGTSIYLINVWGEELWKEDDPLPIMRFDVIGEGRDDTVAIQEGQFLRDVEARTFPDPSRVVRHREFVFERKGGIWVINGLPWDEERDDAHPVGDTVESWDLVNKSGGWVHPIHLHEEFFRVLERNEGPAPAYEALGYKETTRLGPNERVRILKYFSPEFVSPPGSDRAGRFMMHCHISDHEDHHMMTVFHIVPPGTTGD